MENKTAQLVNGVEEIMDIYGNMLFRMCLIRLGNANDAEDAVQETMIKYVQKNPYFKDAEHQKAWLIRVASNKCKAIIKLSTDKLEHGAYKLVVNQFIGSKKADGQLAINGNWEYKFSCE